MDNFIISQLLAAVAIIFDVTSFQLKQRRHILVCLTAASALIGLHFFFLEQYAAAYIYIISCLRFTTAYLSTSKKWLLIFIPLCLITTAFNYTATINLLPMISGILISVASFCKSDKNMRLLIMGSTVIWIMHNILIFTPMGILLESIFLLSNLAGYYRFYIRQQH